MLNHPANLTAAIAGAWTALSCESTPREIAPHVTREQAAILADLESWAHDVLAARPAIQPAREWRTPTQVRRAVAERVAASTESGRTRGKRWPYSVR